MAVLDKPSLSKILKDRPSSKLIDEMTELNKRLNRFTAGIDIEKLLSSKRTEYLESQQVYDCKNKLKKNSVDLYERIIKLRGKVFSAKGGSRVYGVPEAKEKELISYLNSIRKGISLRKYIENSLIRAWDSDPMGVCFVEVSGGTTPLPYPTYKNISCIYDFSFNWRQLDYIIFNLTKDDIKKLVDGGYLPTDYLTNGTKLLRVVDDIRDYVIDYKGDGEYTEIADSIQPNPFNKVPGFILSNFPNKESTRMISTIEPVIELAERYMERDADLSLQEKLHGTLIYWTTPVNCTHCGGTGRKSAVECSECKGSGKELKPKVSTTLVIPSDTAERKYPNPPAGFIMAPKESFQIITDSIDGYEQKIKATYWGDVRTTKPSGPAAPDTANAGQQPTATGEMIAADKETIVLNQISDWFQETEKYLVDLIGTYLYSGSYKSSSISAGRRYVIKSPDELRVSYEDTRSRNLAESIKDDAYYDYIAAKYENDPIQLAIQDKLFRLEPFFHMSLGDVKMNIGDPALIKKKALFGEWKKTISDMIIFATEIEKLRTLFETYVAGTVINEPQPAAPVLN